jgi:hypothetical protein
MLNFWKKLDLDNLGFIDKLIFFLKIHGLFKKNNRNKTLKPKVVIKAEYKRRKIVAVKKMKPGSKDDEINFNREAEFMMLLFA